MGIPDLIVSGRMVAEGRGTLDFPGTYIWIEEGIARVLCVEPLVVRRKYSNSERAAGVHVS